MDFNEYLTSKKIDSTELKKHEPILWKVWADEFVQMSTVSFTSQKLYLINPLRRRFPLMQVVEPSPIVSSKEKSLSTVAVKPVGASAKPVMKARPVFRPKPPEE